MMLLSQLTGLLPPHEQRIKLFHRHLHPRGAAVIALVGAFGGFHVTQEVVHFG